MGSTMTPTEFEKVLTSGPRPAKLAVDQAGEGPTFLWGHALLGSMASDTAGGVLDWRELREDYQVIRYDARGHGRSDCHGEPENFSWESLAGNMWDVRDHYTADPVVLGGASMGCATALFAACQRPLETRGLVLVIPPTAWEQRDALRVNYRRAARIAKLSRGVPLKLLNFVPQAPRNKGFQKHAQSALMKNLASADYRGIVGAMGGAALSDLPEPDVLAQLEMPALILAWPDDPIHPLATAERLQEILPNAELSVARNANDPYTWPAQVRDFLDRL
jgi:pimeloyl-ACP methyl ester carboxylesterase